MGSLEDSTCQCFGAGPGALAPHLGMEVFPHSLEGLGSGRGVAVYAEATGRGKAMWGLGGGCLPNQGGQVPAKEWGWEGQVASGPVGHGAGI